MAEVLKGHILTFSVYELDNLILIIHSNSTSVINKPRHHAFWGLLFSGLPLLLVLVDSALS